MVMGFYKLSRNMHERDLIILLHFCQANTLFRPMYFKSGLGVDINLSSRCLAIYCFAPSFSDVRLPVSTDLFNNLIICQGIYLFITFYFPMS